MMYGMKKTTVYLPNILKARLERAAEEDQTSEAEVIREAIDRFTSDRERPRPKAPLFANGAVAPVENFDEALRGFGER